VTGNATVSAVFAATKYTVNITADANGTVSPSTAQSVGHGDSIEVTATAGAGYAFVNWTVADGIANVAVRTVNTRTTWVVVTGPATIQAHFAAIVGVRRSTMRMPQAFDLTVSGEAIRYAVPSGKQGQVAITVTDMNGKLVADRTAHANAAGYFAFDLKNLRKGFYVCSMAAEGFRKAVKFALVK
jgi:hypothetical protein